MRMSRSSHAPPPHAGVAISSCSAPARLGGYPSTRPRSTTIGAALDLNYLGLIRVFLAIWPQLVERSGRIVNVVSVAGSVPLERSTAYSCSKHAALAWSRALVSEARSHGVTVTTANPGPVPTPGFPQTGIVGHRLARPRCS